jgi:hypothetical protein
MSEWYKVTLPYSEAGIAGKGKSLQDAFEVVFIANRAPEEAAMFTRRSDDLENVFYYFTPGATTIAKGIIQSFGGVECPAPKYDNYIVLLVGHAGAHDKFLKKKG